MHPNRRNRESTPWRFRRAATFLALAFLAESGATAADTPMFVDGQAQVVEAFSDARKWVRESLWVEAEFDSDGDGRRDRMFVDVTRPGQTTTGLKVPVVYETSPYFAALASESPDYLWNPRHELDEAPQPHDPPPPIAFNPNRRRISDSLVAEWVPRGLSLIHI